jgi:hypothetical protein
MTGRGALTVGIDAGGGEVKEPRTAAALRGDEITVPADADTSWNRGYVSGWNDRGAAALSPAVLRVVEAARALLDENPGTNVGARYNVEQERRDTLKAALEALDNR